MRAGFPLPDVDWPPLREFWAGAAAGELRLPRCEGCGGWRWYPSATCRACGEEGLAWTALSGRGHVFSWVVVRHPFLPAFKDEVPFVSALVTPDEAPEVRLATRIVDAEPDEVAIDAPVVVTFRPLSVPDVEGQVVAPLFVLAP